MTDAEKRIGTVLVNKYKIRAFIQKGGMGTVFLATHLDLGKNVAIKIFHPYLAESKELSSRFLNEARGTARLNHRNIVDIIDLGTDEANIPFFVMEYLSGETLKDLLRRRSQGLSVKESADIMIQALTGLHVAHSRGIIHRDLKPGNIFIAKEADGSEVVKVLDFGVAKFRELDRGALAELTTEGSLLGTPSYMSPEQARGKKNEIDSRSDLYSSGLIIYRCLTGLNPFKGETQLETIQNIITLAPPRPSFMVEGIPKEVDDIVMKAIDKDKDARFQDCRSFIEAIKTFYAVAGSAPSEAVAKIVSGEVDLRTPVSPHDETVSQGAIAVPSADMQHVPGSLEKKSSIFKIMTVLLIILLILVVAGTAAWNIYFGKGKGGDDGGAGSKIAGQTENLAATGPSVPPENELVSVRLTGLPEGAAVLVDGLPRSDVPLKLEKSGEPVILSVTRDGKEVWRTSFAPLQDDTIAVEAAEEPAAPPATPLSKPTKKTTKAPATGTASPETKVEEDKKDQTQDQEKGKPRKIFKDYPGSS
jgi:serine/threonine protein kinase